jgi:hypothetical protein
VGLDKLGLVLPAQRQRERPMTTPRRKLAANRKAAKLRSWRVSILRQRAHYVATVQAPGERSAEAAAVAEFNLNEEQRKRLAVRADEN